MEDYKAIYLKLFDTVTEAMEMLCRVQKETMLMYMDASTKELLNENEILKEEK